MGFIPAKEVVLNQLIRVPAVRDRARSSHTTGIQQRADASEALCERFVALLGRPIDSVDVLELGPGRGTGLMAASVDHGVGSYAAFDVEPYLTDEDLPDPSIDYRTDASGRLPWPPDSFDVVWSHSVLEHLRDPMKVQHDVLSRLRRGGVQIALIDLVDHYQDRTDPAVMFNMLRYSDRIWNLMTSHRSAYTNRLRLSDWRSLFADVGFETDQCATMTVDVPPAEMRRLPYLRHLSDEDATTHRVTFVLRKS